MKLDSSFTLSDTQSRVFFVNFMCGSLPLPNSEHIQLLEQTDLHKRALKLLSFLNREYQFAMLKANIQMQTHEDLSRQQREFFLKKEMENIKDELGDTDGRDVEELALRASKKKWSAEVSWVSWSVRTPKVQTTRFNMSIWRPCLTCHGVNTRRTA